jgi:putative tryptophan/tyrosine transport system substrate-binding protein
VLRNLDAAGRGHSIDRAGSEGMRFRSINPRGDSARVPRRPAGQVLRDAAAQLGISLVFMLPEKGTPSEIERVFAAMEQQRPDAVLVSGEGDLYANRQLIAELSVKKRLPTMCPYRDHVEAGALLGYAVDLAELLRRMADDVHQILKGAKPGEIPIYQPTKFELLINLKTAKALGLTVPPALLARADSVIE